MNDRLSYWLNELSRITLLVVALFVPLFFWINTTEYYETPKLLIMLIATAILLIILAVKFIDSGKISLTPTPIDIPLILLGVTFIFSTFFSSSLYTSILGDLPRVHGGLVSYLVYILFYFALVSNLTTGQNEARQFSSAKTIVNLLVFSGIILAVLSLLSYAGVNSLSFLNLPITSLVNFTPAGSSFSLTALLVLLLPFPLLSIFGSHDKTNENEIVSRLSQMGMIDKDFLSFNIISKSLASLLLTLFVATIVLTGSLPTYIVAVLILAITLAISHPNIIKKNFAYLILPIVVAVLLAIGSYVPNLSSKNILFTQANNFPREYQLPFPSSWTISVSAFRDMPFWGSGPASYLFDFTLYKPIDYNSTNLWNIRFDQAFDEYLQTLATLGIPGLLALTLLTVVFITLAVKSTLRPTNSTEAALAISGIAFFAMLAIHPTTLVLWSVGIILIALFMIVRRDRIQQAQTNLSTTKPYQSILNALNSLDIGFDALPEILLIAFLLLIGAAGYFGSRLVLADYYHRQALNSVAVGNGLLAYNQLIQAEQLNPNVDLYHSDLAQTNFALANAIASSKAPTQSSPSGSLTDQDKQNIQILLSQSIAEGRNAATLSPNNPGNWEILASIYRQISGVAQNALAFSLDSYGRAIARDPLNPLLRLNVGGIYYSVKNYDLAIRFFTDSVNLKPDFANGYYNLAIAYRDRGDLQSAITVDEQAMSLIDPKSPDYKVASDLLASLKKALAASTTAASSTVPPAAQTSSALDNKNLPKVLDLKQPENVSTPAAVKK